MQELDRWLLETIYNKTKKSPRLKQWAIHMNRLSKVLFNGVYLFLLIYVLVTRHPEWLKALGVPLTAYLSARTIRFFYQRQRPFVALSQIQSLIPHKAEASFPSMHAMSSMVISLTCYFILGTWTLWLIPVALLTALSRVMVGVHYPSDTGGGALLGMLVSLVAFIP